MSLLLLLRSSAAAAAPNAVVNATDDELLAAADARLWPDAVFQQQAWAVGPPLAAPAAFDNTVVANIPDEAPYAPIEDPSVQSWAIRPPLNAAADQSWNQDEGERFVADSFRPDDTELVRGAPPPEWRAFAVEGGEVQALPIVDDTPQAWSVGPPQNAVAAQAFNQPDETQAQPTDDPTAQAYPIQPPAAAAFDPAAGFPWAREGDEVQQLPLEDPTAPAWAVQPPLNAVSAQAFNVPDEAQAQPVDDPSAQAYPIQPPAAAVFDPAQGFPFNVPQEVIELPGEDPTAPALPLEALPPTPVPFNLDDSERFYQQQLTDDNVGYALGLVPLNTDRATAFNTPQESLDAPVDDPTIQAWLAPDPSVFFPPFNPAAQFPFNQDMGERWVDQRWSFLWADLVNDWGDHSQVQVYPIPPNPVVGTVLSPDPWFRRLQVPPGLQIEAWSLYTSLVGRYGLAEGQQIYAKMLAERKGPFQAGAKYDPERHQPRPAIPHIEIPKARKT